MIETIPNPLDDKGILKEIDDRVAEIMETKGSCFKIADFMPHLVKQAARWGISYGFRLGWRIHENRVTRGRA